jgi:hypothetical protein
MPRIRVPRPFAAIAVASAVACGTDPLVLCACSMPPPHTILHGRVTAPSGAGVQGATVHLDTGPTDCQGMGGMAPAPTDAEGRYVTAVLPTGNSAEQCIRLWAPTACAATSPCARPDPLSIDDAAPSPPPVRSPPR